MQVLFQRFRDRYAGVSTRHFHSRNCGNPQQRVEYLLLCLKRRCQLQQAPFKGAWAPQSQVLVRCACRECWGHYDMT